MSRFWTWLCLVWLVAVLIITGFIVLALAAPAAADTRHKFTADEVRWYLQGVVSGSLPAPWYASTGRCIEGVQSHDFVCLIVARNGRKQLCYRTVISLYGRFILPFRQGACPSGGPAA